MSWNRAAIKISSGCVKRGAQLHAQRVAAAGFFFGKAFQLEHHPDGVFIDGVGVKQVELHLADDMRPLRHIGPQYAVAMHRQQPATYRP